MQAATLTLLALIIGFSFSMATARYDLRKNYEEAEANAIGTEYVRAGPLTPAEAATVRSQLTKYLDLRKLFYRTRNGSKLQQIDADTAELQNQMWVIFCTFIPLFGFREVRRVMNASGKTVISRLVSTERPLFWWRA